MKQALYTLFGILALGLCLMADAHATPIYVFTNASTPIQVPATSVKHSIKVIQLGALSKKIRRVNQAMKGLNPSQAERLVKRWFQANKATLQHAVAGETLAREFNITQIPTIVFDNGAFKVLGQTDVRAALRQYHQWQHQTHTQRLQNTGTSAS